MAYSVAFKASADKSLDKFPKSIQSRILKKALALSDNPRPGGSLKLAGPSRLWRIRVRDYRIIYSIDDVAASIEIFIIAHRREVYRDL